MQQVGLLSQNILPIKKRFHPSEYGDLQDAVSPCSYDKGPASTSGQNEKMLMREPLRRLSGADLLERNIFRDPEIAEPSSTLHRASEATRSLERLIDGPLSDALQKSIGASTTTGDASSAYPNPNSAGCNSDFDIKVDFGRTNFESRANSECEDATSGTPQDFRLSPKSPFSPYLKYPMDDQLENPQDSLEQDNHALEAPRHNAAKDELTSSIEALQAAKTQWASATRKHINNFWAIDPQIAKPHSPVGSSEASMSNLYSHVEEHTKLDAASDRSKGLVQAQVDRYSKHHQCKWHASGSESHLSISDICQSSAELAAEVKHTNMDLGQLRQEAFAANFRARTSINWNLPTSISDLHSCIKDLEEVSGTDLELELQRLERSQDNQALQ